MSQEWVNESDGSEVIPNSSQDSDSTIPYHKQSNNVLSQGKLIVNTNTTHLYFSFILLLNVNNQNEHIIIFTCKGTFSDNSQDAKFESPVGKPDVNSAAMQMLLDAYASEGTKVYTYFKHFTCKVILNQKTFKFCLEIADDDMDITTNQDSQEPTVHLTIDSNRQFDQSQPLFS